MNHAKKIHDSVLICNDNHLINLFIYDHDTPNTKICHVLKMGIVSVIKENNNFLIESFNSKQFQSLFLKVFVSPVYYCSTLLL